MAEEDEGIRGWDGWKASLMQWTWTWKNFGRWWGTGRPGVLQAMGLQGVIPKWVTEHIAKKNLNIYTSEFGMRLEGTTGSRKGLMNTPPPDRKPATLSFVPRDQEDWPLWPFLNRPPSPTHLPNTLAATMCMCDRTSENKATPLNSVYAAQAPAKIFLLLQKISSISDSVQNIKSNEQTAL